MEEKYDFSKYRNETNVSLKQRYGLSLSTFKKNIEAIQPQLEEMRKALRPGAKRGSNFYTHPMLKLLFDHMGGEPHLPTDAEKAKMKKEDKDKKKDTE
ncbi:MAG: hypothetical protein AB7G44_11135 [Bacteroidia bacterium]